MASLKAAIVVSKNAHVVDLNGPKLSFHFPGMKQHRKTLIQGEGRGQAQLNSRMLYKAQYTHI